VQPQQLQCWFSDPRLPFVKSAPIS
jgi:hypothetical protein